MKLPMLEKDKANHVIYGVVIYALHSLVITPVFAAMAGAKQASAQEQPPASA